MTASDTNNGFEVKFIDYVLNEIKHISDIDEFFDTINFLSEEYGFSLKRGIRNKKGEYKLFYAICNKGIRNAKYYAAESQKKGTPTKYTKTSKTKLTRCPAKYRFRIEDSGITLLSSIKTYNHELFEEPLELSHNMINDIISHPHNANITHIASFLSKKYIREFTYSQIYREFRKFYVKFKANDASNLVNNLRQRRFELRKVINDQDESLTKLIFINQDMRNHYFQYNDVLLIDSTYKTNKYSYPLVIISGADNEGKNIIFAVAFINDETQATYKWVLNSFSNLMESVHPTIIISDQD